MRRGKGGGGANCSKGRAGDDVLGPWGSSAGIHRSDSVQDDNRSPQGIHQDSSCSYVDAFLRAAPSSHVENRILVAQLYPVKPLASPPTPCAHPLPALQNSDTLLCLPAPSLLPCFAAAFLSPQPQRNRAFTCVPHRCLRRRLCLLLLIRMLFPPPTAGLLKRSPQSTTPKKAAD